MERDRSNFRRELGVENSAYKDAGAFYTLISIIYDLVKNNGPLVDYKICNYLLLKPLFGKSYGTVVDSRRRCIWAIDVQPCDIPLSLPPGIDEIRTIWTFDYKWYFSIHNTKSGRWVDIRKPRGRLAVLELVDGPNAGRNRYLRLKTARRAVLEATSAAPSNVPPAETEKAVANLSTEMSNIEIVDGCEQIRHDS